MVSYRWRAALLAAVLAVGSARGQGTSGPTVSDSSVGYIDPAIPGNIIRFAAPKSVDVWGDEKSAVLAESRRLQRRKSLAPLVGATG